MRKLKSKRGVSKGPNQCRPYACFAQKLRLNVQSNFIKPSFLTIAVFTPVTFISNALSIAKMFGYLTACYLVLLWHLYKRFFSDKRWETAFRRKPEESTLNKSFMAWKEVRTSNQIKPTTTNVMITSWLMTSSILLLGSRASCELLPLIPTNVKRWELVCSSTC